MTVPDRPVRLLLALAVVAALLAALMLPIVRTTRAARMSGALPGADHRARLVVTSARDPLNGRGSPRQRPAMPGRFVGPDSAETAGGAPLSGNAGYAVPALGSSYLAMRLPRGTLVTIIGPGGTWTTRVTDYGPSSKIRPSRIADIALGHWLVVCGLPASAGLCRITVTGARPLPTGPPSDVAP